MPSSRWRYPTDSFAGQPRHPRAAPSVEPREQDSQHIAQAAVADDRTRQRDRRCLTWACGDRSDQAGFEVDHAPAPRRAAERVPVVHLAGVRADQIASLRLDFAAAAGRTLRALLDQADAEGVVRMAREAAGAVDLGAVNLGPRGAEHAAAMMRGRRLHLAGGVAPTENSISDRKPS